MQDYTNSSSKEYCIQFINHGSHDKNYIVYYIVYKFVRVFATYNYDRICACSNYCMASALVAIVQGTAFGLSLECIVALL